MMSDESRMQIEFILVMTFLFIIILLLSPLLVPLFGLASIYGLYRERYPSADEKLEKIINSLVEEIKSNKILSNDQYKLVLSKFPWLLIKINQPSLDICIFALEADIKNESRSQVHLCIHMVPNAEGPTQTLNNLYNKKQTIKQMNDQFKKRDSK
jgi:hypothetical protein